MECEICCQNKIQLFSIANCNHLFCEDCCIAHISAKADQFSSITCPQSNCNKTFSKSQTIMSNLSPKVIQSIQKRERFNYLIQHPQLKPCSVLNCQGTFQKKDIKKLCNLCGAAHCPKCSKTFHDGPCIIDQSDQQMISLSYQKCPTCGIWVQKKQGCDYIDCKCGNTFCYRCGINFNDDPCRLKEIRELQNDLKLLIKKLKYKMPQEKAHYPFLLIKVPFQLLFFFIFTAIFSLSCTALLLLGISLVVLLSPIIVIAISCQLQKTIHTSLILLTLPLWIALFVLFFFIVLVMYQFLRKSNHHGIYDGFDIGVCFFAIAYLKVAVFIFN